MAIAGRARACPSALGADTQGATRIDPRDGTSPCPNCVDTNRGKTACVAVDTALMGYLDDAILDSTYIRGGTTHVKGHNPVVAEIVGKSCRSNDTASRTGEEDSSREMRRVSGGHETTGGPHDSEASNTACANQPIVQSSEVGRGDRHEVRVEHGCGDAFELTELARNH
jgi:hypothetical protein